MWLKIYLFCAIVVISKAADEGEFCLKDGWLGKCTNIIYCKTAIQDLRNRKQPKICSFVKTDPIVCCMDNLEIHRRVFPIASTTTTSTTTTTTTTTTRRPHPKPTTQPPTPEPRNYDQMCESLPLSMTPKKTGQKAFDKCIDYQQKYVFPCDRGVDLLGRYSRSFHCHHTEESLIVGGIIAHEHEFPHMVMIGYGALDSVAWLCGGTLISERFILTAGHCIAHRDLGSATYALIGAMRRSEAADSSKVYKIKTITPHPQYKAPKRYHDIALMETENEIKLDQFVLPACLHIGDDVNDDEVVATGWGDTHYKGSRSDYLQRVKLTKFSTAQCSQQYPESRLMTSGFDPESQMCYGDMTTSRDTCQGDSGGPIQIKSRKISCMYTIVGVTSFGRACGFTNSPGIYTRVANYVSWIENIVWPN